MGAEVLLKHRADVGEADAASGEGVPVPLLGQVWLTAESKCPALDCFLEAEVFEGVQRVVVDEDTDRPLRGEKVGGPFDGFREAG